MTARPAAGGGSSGGKRPVVAAFMGVQAVGDFVTCHLVAASVARALGARLLALYRDDRPYKALVTLMNPWVTRAVRVPADPAAAIPLDWFDGAPGAAGRPFGADGDAEGEGFQAPDVLLVPSMMAFENIIPPAPRFRLPAALEPALAATLAARGVDPGRWFACLHMREAGYVFRRISETIRNVDPATYIPMVSRIIREQGGQVVRLGDPTMTPLPPQPGFIDLAHAGAGFAEQTFALSRARYFVGTDSGPTVLAGALGVPTAATNVIGSEVFNSGDIVLQQRIRASGGRWLDAAESRIHFAMALERGQWGLEFARNAPEELAAVADAMFERTADCPAWRVASAVEAARAEAPVGPHASISLPLTWRNVASDFGVLFADDVVPGVSASR